MMVAMVSLTGRSARSGASSSSASAWSPRWKASMRAKDLPRISAGSSGDRRQPQEAAERGELVGDHAAGEVPPGVQHLGPAFDGVPQDAGVQLCDWEQPQLQGGDDAEAAAAAAQRPEQVGLVLAVGAAELAVGGHYLDRQHVAGRQAVLAAQEAQAAAEGVTHDADVG